jgi:hypothetical protein
LERLRAIGFTHVAVDIEGYTMGSLNRSLPTTPKPTQRS